MPSIKLGDYLFRRVHELGIRSVFGVPGDYELALLDLVEENQLQWRGNPNELVASYAADGYARVNGAAAFVSTFGPGETSAYCGVAGQYTEYVPVAHIVGYPGVEAMKKGAIMHHTLGDGKFDFCLNMSKEISVATTVLKDPETAGAEIDRVLTTMIYESRPVYIGVPADMAYAPVSDEPLKTPLVTTLPKDEPSVIKSVVKEIRSRLEKASKPILLVDGNTARNNVISSAHKIMELTGLPTFVTPMGKGCINEELPNYGGLYSGAGSHPEVAKVVESADAVLSLGRYASDFNTGEFTVHIDESKVVDLQRFHTTIGGEKTKVTMQYLLQALVADFEMNPYKASWSVTWDPYPLKSLADESGPLVQDALWAALGRFFQPGDLIIGETGTSAFGLGDSFMPNGSFFFNQTIFGSIGYATGAIVGAAQAIKEQSGMSAGKFKRGILVTGEGSMHLTAQAIGDMLRYELQPIIFVLNNDGYTVERLIHGPEAEYNKVAYWDYSKLAATFGPAFKSTYHGPITKTEQLVKLLSSGELRGSGFQLVEVVLGVMDAPKSVKLVGAAIDEFNKQKFAVKENAVQGA